MYNTQLTYIDIFKVNLCSVLSISSSTYKHYSYLAQLLLGFTVMNIIKIYVALSKWNVKMNSSC